MPFTFSHPALVLSLNYLPKRWFSLTGLIIGSLTPDFEYFIRMELKSLYSHTFEGILWLDLPIGLLMAFIFHNIVRKTLFDNLPVFLKSRFFTYNTFNWNIYFKKNWFVVLVSLFIGAVSHIFWDSFTHIDGYFVQTIPNLTNRIAFFTIEIPIFKILQHSSTLIGGFIIFYTVYKLPYIEIEKGNINLKYWLIVFTLTTLIIFLRIFGDLELTQYGNIIVSAISAVMISISITPLFIEKIEKNN